MTDATLSRPDIRACFAGQEQAGILALPTEIFEVERDGETVLVTLKADLRGLDYPEIAAGGKEVLRAVNSGALNNVVVDFHNSDRYRSATLVFLIFLWKKVRACGGKMAVCNVTDRTLEKLRTMNLNRLWLLCGSKKEALRRVRNDSAHTTYCGNSAIGSQTA